MIFRRGYSTKALHDLTLTSISVSSLITLLFYHVHISLIHTVKIISHSQFIMLSPSPLVHCTCYSLSPKKAPSLPHSFSRSQIRYNLSQEVVFISLLSQPFSAHSLPTQPPAHKLRKLHTIISDEHRSKNPQKNLANPI